MPITTRASRKNPCIEKRVKNARRRSTIALAWPSGADAPASRTCRGRRWPRTRPARSRRATGHRRSRHRRERRINAKGTRTVTQDREGRRRDAQLEPLGVRMAHRPVAQPSGQDAEAQRHEQPRVEVAGRHTEPALVRGDVLSRSTCPSGWRPRRRQGRADRPAPRPRTVRPAPNPQRVGDPHGARDEERPGQTDDQRRAVDDQHPVAAVVVGLEDQLVALLEQEAEGRGADRAPGMAADPGAAPLRQPPRRGPWPPLRGTGRPGSRPPDHRVARMRGQIAVVECVP